MVQIAFKIFPSGGFFKQHDLRNPPVDGQVAGSAPSIIVFIDGYLGHRVGGHGVRDVHVAGWNQVHQPSVFSIRVHGKKYPSGMEGFRRLSAPGHDLFFKVGGVGHHIVHVCGPQDDIRGGIRQDGEQLIIGMFQSLGQFSHLLMVIMIVIIEICGPNEGLLDEMHGRRACDSKPLPHSHAVLSNFIFPPKKTLVSRFQGEISKEVSQNVIIFRPFDGGFLDPCDGGPGLFHLFGASVPHAHHSHGGMVFHMGHLLVAIVFIVHPDIYIRRELKIIGELF